MPWVLVLGVIVGLVLTWRIITVSMAHFYGAHIGSDPHARDAALSWYIQHPLANFEAALALLREDPRRAQDLLRQALQGNPAHGRGLLVLARLWLEQRDVERADEGVQLAVKLHPGDADLRMVAAAYWQERGSLGRAFQHWGAALEARPSLRQDLYPLFLRLLEEGGSSQALKSMLGDAPPWWEGFFGYAAHNAVALETVHRLFGLRHGSAGVVERRHYIQRLQREGHWDQAYITWANGLGPEQLEVLGPVYNGSFELAWSEMGFDWHAPKVEGVVVEQARSYGVQGEKALHMIFQGTQRSFQHIYQPLFLAAGPHRLGGRVRPDSLSGAGLHWRIECANGHKGILASSERFVGLDQWREFSLDFSVPESDCDGQILRLVHAPQAANDDTLRGEVWFDALEIERIKSVTSFK